MAFTVVTEKREYTWNVPSEKPLILEPVIKMDADGHELEQIMRRFDNLPYAHSRSTWRGYMAQFIYDNL